MIQIKLLHGEIILWYTKQMQYDWLQTDEYSSRNMTFPSSSFDMREHLLVRYDSFI